MCAAREKQEEREKEREEREDKAATLGRPHSCENKYCKTKKKMYCMWVIYLSGKESEDDGSSNSVNMMNPVMFATSQGL